MARSSPRSLASVPPYLLDITQAKFFGKLFLQILPLSGTNFASILQAPSFYHTLGLSAQRRQYFPSISFVLKRLPLVFPSTSSPRPPTSRVFRLARLFPFMQPLCRPNPRTRTSNFCLCACLRKSFWLLSTPKIKLLSFHPGLSLCST